jgi:hypothetical protein
VIRTVVVPAPQAGSEPSPLIARASEVWRRRFVQFFGHDDLADSAEALTVAYREQTTRHKLLIVVLEGEELVGASWVGMPLRDNTTLAEGDIVAVPGADAGAVTRAVWAELAPRLVEAGRRTVQLWTIHPIPAGQEDPWVVPGTGVGRLRPDPVTVVLQELGFRLEQVERHSQLDVADALTRVDALEAGAVPHAGDYEVFSWFGATPVELRSEMAEVTSHMATDIPSGEFEIEEEDWDADRIAETERVGAEMGRARVTTVARHRASGRLVAYTHIDHPSDKPPVGYQEDTLVVSEHRGHRLGMLVKIGNLRALAEHLPSVKRIHTWNAGENEHMLAINHALGFRDVSLEGGWQLTHLTTTTAP